MLALVIRLPRLAERPMHTDEAVNAYLTGKIISGAGYHYDNRDRHGPVLYAVAAPLARICGARSMAGLDEVNLRLGPVLVGALVVLLFGLLARETGNLAAALAALLWAFAPLPLFYNRYFIHETLFIAATFGLLLAGWRWLNTGSVRSAALTGLCAGLLLAGKETAVITFAAAGAAAVWWYFEAKAVSLRNILRWPALLAAAGAFLLILVLLFSWGGTNWQGLADIFHAAPNALNRAGGQGHAKPAGYYLKLLADGWSGKFFLVLALLGAWRALKNPGAPRLCVIYTVVIAGIYSAIPYKTPWLALNLWLPLALLAAGGAAWFWDAAKSLPLRAIALLGAVAFAVLLAQDTRRWCFRLQSNERNPYVYSHTGEDITRLPERLDKLTRPADVIAVIAADAWPLPWYLRSYPRVGYWQPEQKPDPANFYITSSLTDAPPPPQVTGWRYEIFGARPGALLILWVPPDPAP